MPDRRSRLSHEDELIIGLLRKPELISDFRLHLDDMRTTDEDAAAIIRAMLTLTDEGRYNRHNLVAALKDHPEAMTRVVHLVDDHRNVAPKWFVETALESLKEKHTRRIKDQYGKTPDGL